ncbi:hypothetical protein Hanom_Chr01g00033991 [Helianthus anomalus]
MRKVLPMHDEREKGGRVDFEGVVPPLDNLGMNHDVAQEVGPVEVDKGDFNKGSFSERGIQSDAGRVGSGGPSAPGFNVGLGNIRRTGFKKPKIMAQPRKEKGRCLTPTEPRPKKRSRLALDEGFSFTPSPQRPESDPGVAQVFHGRRGSRPKGGRGDGEDWYPLRSGSLGPL